MSARTVAIQLRTLASDPASQKFMCSDQGCINGLMTFLDSKDEEILTISLQTLHFLSSHPANREALSKQPGLLVKLVNFTEKDNKIVKQVASQCLENLQSYVNGLQEKKEKDVPFSPKYLYNVNLHVTGLIPLYRYRVEKALIGVKGVVSVTFEEKLEDVTVYCTQKEDDMLSPLLTAIENLDLKLSACSRASAYADKENIKASSSISSKRNSLLSQTDKTQQSYATSPSAADPSTPPSRNHSSSLSSAGAPAYFDKSNVRRGSVTLYSQSSTLKDRQAEQRRRESEAAAKQSSVRSLFGKVTSYFW